MASKWYPAGLAIMLNEGYQWDSANLKMGLINSATSYNSAHDYYADVSGGAVDTPKALTTPTASVTGVTTVKLDADDSGANLTWVGVLTGSTIGAVVVYYDTGNSATSPLLTFNDVTDTPTNGGNIVITIHANGIGTFDCA